MEVLKDKSAVDYIGREYLQQFPFPFLPGYWKYLEETRRTEVLLVIGNDTIMPVQDLSRHGFHVWKIMFPPIMNGKRLSEVREQKFLNDFVQYVTNKKLVYRFLQTPNHALFKTSPDHSIQVPFGSYVIDLENQEIDQIWMGMKSNYRQVIRKAEREGVEVRTGRDQLDIFYTLYRSAMKRSGIYQEPYSDFIKLYELIPSENIYCSTVWFNNQPEGALFCLYSKFGAYILHAGSSDHVKHRGSIKLLHWHTIKFMKEKKVKCYDFVGARLTDVTNTPYEGIQRFKSGFGCELLNGYLWKMDIDFVHCKMIDMIHLLKSHGVPQKDFIDRELKKVGHY